jgi:hypothetical protein
MIACCSCKVSPNGMQGFSLATDLISNQLTSTGSSLKVVSSPGGEKLGNFNATPPGPTASTTGFACDAGTFYPLGGVLETSITHVCTLGTSMGVTEIAFDTAPIKVGNSVLHHLEVCESRQSRQRRRALQLRPEKSILIPHAKNRGC